MSVTWLTLFTHHDVRRATVDGQEITIGREQEVGMNAYDTPFIYIPPMGSVTLEFELEGALDLSSGYELVVMPQPVANPDVVDVSITSGSGSFTGADTVDGGGGPGGSDERADHRDRIVRIAFSSQ